MTELTVTKPSLDATLVNQEFSLLIFFPSILPTEISASTVN